jgi:hypothetical protein
MGQSDAQARHLILTRIGQYVLSDIVAQCVDVSWTNTFSD